MSTALIRITDEATGRQWGPSSFLPAHIIEIADATNINRMITEMVGWEANFIEQEFDDILFTQLGTVESVDPAQTHVGYQQRTKTGQADWISRRESNFGTIGADTLPFMSPVIPLGVAYDINLFEDLTARKFGVNLDAQSMMDCAEYIDQKLEEAWHLGGKSPDNLQVTGMFNLFNGGGTAQLAAGTTLPKVALTPGASGNTWDQKTGNEIDADIAAGIAAVQLASKGKKRVNKIVMGLRAWVEIQKKDIRDDDGGTIRLMPYLQRTYPGIQWVVDNYFDNMVLTNANESFTGGTGVFFYADAPNNFKFRANRREVVRPYEAAKGFQLVKVNTYGLCAGIQAFNNYFGAYMKDVLAAV